MALKLYKDGEIEVDTTDKDLLEKVINASAAITAAGKAQLLLVIKTAK
jgi:hypothetical protein